MIEIARARDNLAAGRPGESVRNNLVLSASTAPVDVYGFVGLVVKSAFDCRFPQLKVFGADYQYARALRTQGLVRLLMPTKLIIVLSLYQERKPHPRVWSFLDPWTPGI